MRKPTIACPKCKTAYDPDAVMKSRRRVTEKMTPVKPALVDEVVPDVDTEVAADELVDGEDAVLEDASELGEDDEDISEAIEGAGDDAER
jgi:hypothetical protein